MIFKMADGGHLGFHHQYSTKNNHSRVFSMPVLVEVDTLIVRLAHQGKKRVVTEFTNMSLLLLTQHVVRSGPSAVAELLVYTVVQQFTRVQLTARRAVPQR